MVDLPPVDDIEAELQRAAAAGVALKRAYPASRAEERVRDAELIRLHAIVVALRQGIDVFTANRGGVVAQPRQAINAPVVKPLTNGANGHALAKPAGGGRLTKHLGAFAKELGKELGPVLRALEQRLAKELLRAIAQELVKRDRQIAELKARSTMKYEGVWDAEKVYSVGDFVTDGGSLWHCWDTNRGARPGSSDAWQLAVRRGKDGRDAKGSR